MRKYKIFFDLDKEERWLNEMAEEGWIFQKHTIFGSYFFDQGEVANRNYRIDVRTFNSNIAFTDYVTLFSDAGWQHVYGTKHSGNQYFLPKADSNQRDIFSDALSKANRYKRTCEEFSSLLATWIVYCVIIFTKCGSNITYQTPGLWDLEGKEFWRAFWFETPFVILRVVPFVLFFILFIYYGYGVFVSRQLYKKNY